MKKKIIPLIISAAIFISGLVTTLAGVSQNSGTVPEYPEIDLFNISESDVGKTFSGSHYVDVMEAGETGRGSLYLLWVYSEEDDSEVMVIGFDVPKSACGIFADAMSTGAYSWEKKLPFYGTVRKSNDEITGKLSDTITWYYNYLEEIYGEENPADEEIFAKSYENISPYYIEVAGTSNGDILICVGAALMAVAVIGALIILFGKKVLIIFAVLIVIAIIILFIILSGKLRTMASVTEVSDGLYKMTCHYDYNCDKFINADISTIDGLIKWIIDEQFFGIDVEIDTGNFGCCAFTAETPEGQRIFGRNFDYEETDTLVFYTDPEDGYASYGVTDLKFFDIGEKQEFDGSSVIAKALMLAAPYVTMDGINEAGVGVGILQLDIDELHQDNGKPDLLIFAAIRGILDNCATVDEAIELLSKYDIHSFLSRSYHLFITDKTGKSVIVEWTDEETFIVEDTACTNDVMSENKFYDPDWSCKRYDTIKNRLSEKNNIITEDEAMTVASDVSKDKKSFSTEWSCVYNLDAFTFDICLDRDYGTKYSFTKEDFR